MRSCSRPLSRPRSSARLGLASAFSCLLLIVGGEARGQAPPPADAPSPIVQATRALRTGHYDEIESLTASRSDEASQQVRAQAHVARGRYAEAIAILTPFATAEPAGASALELGLLYRLLGRTADATRLLTTVVERSGRNQDQGSLVRAARAARALSRFEQANESYRAATMLGVDDPIIQAGWGELFLEKHNQADALKSFRQACRSPRMTRPRTSAWRACWRTRIRRSRAVAARALAIDACSSRRTCSSPSSHSTTPSSRRDGAIRQALAVNPSSLEALVARGLGRVPRRPTRPTSTPRCAAVLAINPAYGEVYRIAGAQAAAALPLRRGGGARATGGGARPDRPARRTPTSACTCCAPATSRRRAPRSTRAFPADPFDVVTFNLLQLLDTLDKFVTVARRRHHPASMHRDEAPVLQEYAMPLAQRRAPARSRRATASRRRARSSSRSSRGTTTSPSATSACPA